MFSLRQSMAAIVKEHNNEAVQEKIEMVIAYCAMVPAALSKFQNKGGNPTKVTKKEIISILFCVPHTG
jgi:hypothetical protein